MKLAIIAAIARNRVIGNNGTLPWHISEDLKRFKRLTVGHTVLMGRKTYESIGKPLVNRRNVVVSSQEIPGVECYRSVDAALNALKDVEIAFVIGGGQLYSELLPKADILHLTLLDRNVEGDTHFPRYEHLIGPVFTEISRETHDGFMFVDFERSPSSVHR
ncbi:MAG: dihydrofolate reductase [Bacteroidota bacterium]